MKRGHLSCVLWADATLKVRSERGAALPLMTVVIFLTLVAGAAVGSAMTAPAQSSFTAAPTTPVPLPTTVPPPTSTEPPTTTTVPAPPTSTVPSTTITVPIGSVPPAGALSSAIELPTTTLVGGSTVSGVLVVTNHTDKTINLTETCSPDWEVGLQSATIPFNPAFPADCSTGPFLLQPGTNRLPFTLDVSYNACTNGGGASPSVPPCLTGGIPPLPPGPYQAILVGPSALSAKPVDVEVVPPPG